MIATLRALALTLPFVIGAASADTEFTAVWPDGQTLSACVKPPIPGMSDPCEDARLGYWQPVGMPPIRRGGDKVCPERVCVLRAVERNSRISWGAAMTPAARRTCRAWYERNTELAKARAKASKEKNPERTKENARRWRAKNRLPLNLVARLREVSKQRGLRIDCAAAVKSLGCSLDEFRAYIEAQFEPGMCWDNWSRKGWHLDHIRPLMAFNLAVNGELDAACHYTNYQPLWSGENLAKRAADLKLHRDRKPFQRRFLERNDAIIAAAGVSRDAFLDVAAGFGVNLPWALKILRRVGASPPAIERPSHCKHGHLLDEANLYITSAGARQCRACNSVRSAQYSREGRYRRRGVAVVQPNTSISQQV